MRRFIFLLLILVIGCGSSISYTDHETPLPIVKRIDTTEFMATAFADSFLWTFVKNTIKEALPNETAFCFYGYAKDTTVTVVNSVTKIEMQVPVKIAVIDSAAPARIDSSTDHNISYTDKIACLPDRRLVGIAHTHPLTPRGALCGHSHMDALYLHRMSMHFWFSMVFCRTSTSLLWQDGRRVAR